MKNIMIKIFVLFLLLHAGGCIAAEDCGNVYDIDIGPWDYTDPKNHSKELGGVQGERISKVENVHFTKDVENLVRGNTSNELMADLSYTLVKFPNHHRALLSLIKYDLKHQGKLPNRVKFHFTQSVNCYFKRAMTFKPNDPQIYHLYGIYFYKNKKYQQAIEQLKRADSKLDSPELDYNIGLTYFAMEDFKNSKIYADKAYANQFPLPGLCNKLNNIKDKK